MFRRKFYLSLSLLLGTSYIVTQGLTSCETVKEQFKISLTSNFEGGGIIKADKKEGEVGESVTISVELNEGFTLAHIKVNGEVMSEGATSFKFIPTAGDNKVEVVFADDNGNIIDPGAKPIKGKFEFKIVLNGNHGIVEADKVSGKVGENVTVLITPDPGWEIEAIEFNGELCDLNTRVFKPVEGKNKLKVSFVKKEEEHFDWKLEIISNEGGTIKPNALQGKTGEKIEIEVVLEPEYVLDKILFNGKDFNVDTRVFEPTTGTNKLEVSFIHENDIIKLDKGFKLTGKFEKEHETDIKSPTEFLETINQCEKKVISWFFSDSSFEYLVENSPEFNAIPRMTGITKKELIEDVDIAFSPTLKKITNNEYDFSNVEDVKEVVTYFKNVYDNLSLAEWYAFSCIHYLGQMANVHISNSIGTFTLDNGRMFTPILNIFENEKVLSEFNHIPEVVSYLNSFEPEKILNNNRGILFSDELKQNILYATEFGYKLVGKLFAITRDVDTIAKSCVTLFKFINSGNLNGLEKDFVQMANLFGRLITEGFCDKDSFPLFLNSLTLIQDMMNENFAKCSYFGYSSTVGTVIPDYKKLMPEILDDIHHLYRSLKFIGFICKDITLNEINFVKILMNTGGDIKYGESFVYASKAFIRAYTNLGNEAVLVKEAIPKAVTKLDYIFKHIFNAVDFINDESSIVIDGSCTNIFRTGLDGLNSNLDIDKVLAEIETASKKDPTNLTEQEEQYYRNFVETELLQNVSTNLTYVSYKFTGKTKYNLGEKLDISITKYVNDQEIETVKLKESDVTEFSTDKRKFGHLYYKLDDLRTITIRYTVDTDISRNYLYYESNDYNHSSDDIIYVPSNADMSKFKLEYEVDKFEIVGLDLTKFGKQYIAIKINNDFIFGSVYVYDINSVVEINMLSNRSSDDYLIPLNEEIDFGGERFSRIYTCDCINVDGKMEVINVKNEEYVNITDINNTGSTKCVFDKEGLQTIDVKSSYGEEEKNYTVTINVEKPISKKYELRTNGTYFFNLLGATRLEDEIIPFEKYVTYEFQNGHGYSLQSNILNLKANDFDNDLDLNKINLNGGSYAIDSYNGIEFGFIVYQLQQEFLNTNFIGNSYTEFTFISGTNPSAGTVSNGNYYIYKDLYNNETVKAMSTFNTINTYQLKKAEKLDTSKNGQHNVSLEVFTDETMTSTKKIDANYNVTDLFETECEELRIYNNISDVNAYPDDFKLSANLNISGMAYSLYTGSEIHLDSNEEVNDLTFGEIKNLIDFNYKPFEEQRIQFFYNGRKVTLIVTISK